MCETENDAEDKDVVFVGGVADVGVFRYESEGFTLSDKKLSGKRMSEGVVDISHLPQCEFANLQHLPLTSQLENLCWLVIEFC